MEMNRHTVIFSFADLQDSSGCCVSSCRIGTQDQEAPVGVHVKFIHCTPKTQC